MTDRDYSRVPRTRHRFAGNWAAREAEEPANRETLKANAFLEYLRPFEIPRVTLNTG